MKVVWLAAYSTRAARVPSLADRAVRDWHPAPWLDALAAALTRQNAMDLTVIALSRDVSREETFRADGVDFVYLPASRGYVRLGSFLEADRRRLVAAARSRRPDVVHGHGTESEYGIAAATSGYPSVVTIQGLMSDLRRATRGGSAWRQAWYALTAAREREAVHRCDAVIAHTSYVRRWVESVEPGRRVFDVPNVASETFWSAEYSGPDGSDVPYFTYVGRLDEAKGYFDLLSAFAALRERVPAVRLRVISPGGDSGAATLAIRKRGLGDSVSIEGPLDSAGVVGVMKGCVAVVHPSHAENFPTSVLEALTLGCPVIASRVGGLPEMIDAGRTGLLFEAGDIGALVAQMEDVLENPARARALGRAARDYCSEHFSPDVVAQRTLACYETVSALGRVNCA